MITHYLLDTNAAFNYVRQYHAIPALPTVRHMMDRLIHEARIFSLMEVKEETQKKEDAPAVWARETSMPFETTHDRWLPEIMALQQAHPTIVKADWKHNADPILLACVRDRRMNGNPDVECVIVTFDTNLQTVCEHEGVGWIDVPELLRREMILPLQLSLPLGAP